MVDDSKSKCGEIFRIDNGSYVFVCFHCGAEFHSSSDIIEHIEKHFLWNPLPFAAAFNFTVNVKLEDESKEIINESFSQHTSNELVEPKIEVEDGDEVDSEVINNNNNDNADDDDEDVESDHWPGDIFDLDEKQNANKSKEISVKDQPIVKQNVTKVRKKRSVQRPSSKSSRKNINQKGKQKCTFSCETCGKQFNYKSQIRDHVTIHANIPPQHYQCDVCSTIFNKKFSLRLHLSKHRPEDFHINGPMICKHCGKQFSFFNKFSKHVAAHETVKPHKCSICYNRFVTEKNLERHQRQHEANKFPKSICSQCGKSFPNKSVLTKHFRIHTGERPYACKVCQKTYNTSSYLIIHMRSHTGERPYQCTLCGRTYVAANKLNEHMKWHNNVRPYKCNQCSKTFLLLENLKRHEPKHNQVRPVCKICNKSFSMDRTYRQHMQLHDGIGKYKCRHCDDSFSSSVSRQNHEYNLHRYTINEFAQQLLPSAPLQSMTSLLLPSISVGLDLNMPSTNNNC